VLAPDAAAVLTAALGGPELAYGAALCSSGRHIYASEWLPPLQSSCVACACLTGQRARRALSHGTRGLAGRLTIFRRCAVTA